MPIEQTEPKPARPGIIHRQNNYARRGMVPVSCTVADLIRASGQLTVAASRTDLSGRFGDPEVFTEWDLPDRTDDTPILIEHRWPNQGGDGDAYRCEHYAAADPRTETTAP